MLAARAPSRRLFVWQPKQNLQADPHADAPATLFVQIDNLSSLQELCLVDCGFTEGSMLQLTTLSLQSLELLNATVPPCLSALTGLTCLAVSAYRMEELQVMDTALAPLSALERLALQTSEEFGPQPRRLPSCLTALHSLRRFCFETATQSDAALEALPGGAWLTSLRWLVRGPALCMAARQASLRAGAHVQQKVGQPGY